MKTYILDDEPAALEVLEIHLTKHFPALQLVGKNTQPLKAIPEIILCKPDLLFIDIQMPKLNGFEVLEKLPKPWPSIIFVTAYDKFAIEAIKCSALYYLLKPINIKELKVAVEKAIEVIQTYQHQLSLEELLNNLKLTQSIKQKIALKNNDTIEYIEPIDILRCEADNNYTKIFIRNQKKILISKTLKEFEHLLTPHDFIRIHQSHLINKAHIKRFIKTDGGSVILSDGTELPVARARKDQLTKCMEN
jgi:two-component system, LytTR family, response regulator